MNFSGRLPSLAGVGDALLRCIKLTLAMLTLGFVLAFVAYNHQHSAGVESALWQGGSLVAFLLLAGVLHERYRAGENLALAYLWAILLALGVVAILSFLVDTQWPALLRDDL